MCARLQAGHPIGSGRSLSFAFWNAFSMSVGVGCPAVDEGGWLAFAVESAAWTICARNALSDQSAVPTLKLSALMTTATMQPTMIEMNFRWRL